MIDAPLALPDKPSIAVLPFANMSGGPEQEIFRRRMVEEVITPPSVDARITCPLDQVRA
ncbi:MAG: hypothetical protein JO358_02830 [Alphaproteobacteria bacterium]|nr:hypothetical protein [Alphaproteobacteria bacterium]